MDRKNAEEKYKWDLSAIYRTEADFDAELAEVEKMITTFPAHESKMCESAENLLSALRDDTAIGQRIQKLWSYAYLGFAVNTADNPAQGRVARVRALAVKAESATWFLSPLIMKMDADVLADWYKECPELEEYRRTIEKSMARKPYTLSDESEQLLAKMGNCLDTHEDIRGIFANSDLKFGRFRDGEGKMVELTDANFVPYLMNTDRRVRQSAFRTYYKTYEQFANTFGTMYAHYVKERCELSKIRGYKSSLTASTFSDEVTPVIYNSLIKSVHKAMPVVYDYYELKREALGLEKLHMYDVYVPLVGELDAEYSYEQAVEEALKTVEVFGKEYYDTLKAGLTERGWVDVYPGAGKRGGAFSAGCPSTEPYILLNYMGNYNDMSTLVHEAGHSMHSYFSRKYNPAHRSHYTIFVAEVASTINELLLAHRKLRESNSREEKLYILNQIMETYKSTLYRQTMFAEFERDIHALYEKGTPLTSELICKNYRRLINLYFGKNVAKDSQITYEWMRVPHFYSAFYVYKYATCISAASAIVKRIEDEGESYIGKYIDFLKCGDTISPVESLKVAGIDMTDPSVIEGAIEDFSRAIAEFRRIYNEK